MRARQFIPVLILGILLLPACVPQPVAQPPEPAPSATPVFASEEEALAAAVAAYEAYLKVSDEIAADGGAHPERLKDLVTEEWYEKEVEVSQRVVETGLFQVGSTMVGRSELQRLDAQESFTEIVIYVCTDFSGTSFRDINGADVTPSARVELLAFQVAFEAVTEADLRLSESEPWPEFSC